MARSSLARRSGGSFASTSGGMSVPVITLVGVISQAPVFRLKESASAHGAIIGVIGPGMSPRTINNMQIPSTHEMLVMVVLLPA